MIEFIRPWAWLLVPLPWLVWHVIPPHRRRAALQIPDRLGELLQIQAGVGHWLSGGLRLRWMVAMLGWLALVAALAGPLTAREPLLNASGRDLMVTLDLSASMLHEDVSLDGKPVSRATAVRTVAGEFIRGREGDRVGLIAFADQPFLIAPLTYDVVAVDAFLHEIRVGLPGRKTAIGDALAMAVDQLARQPAASRVAILLSDGDGNAGSIQPEDAVTQALEKSVRVHTIGFGTTEDAQTELTSIARATGGEHFTARSSAQLAQVYDAIDALEPMRDAETPRHIEKDWTPVCLWLALAMLILLTLIDTREARP